LSLNGWAATVAPQPLRRLITPIGFGDKALKIKRYAVFDQTFSQKVCVFDQTFFEKVCEQAFFEKVCEQAFFEKVCGSPVHQIIK
jgi:hypothetical protein